MKRIRLLFTLLSAFAVFLDANSQNADSMMVNSMDSVEISLLTCSPHEEIYSLYGHTAIRILDKRTGEDVAVNYGMFSFQKPSFVLRSSSVSPTTRSASIPSSDSASSTSTMAAASPSRC